MDIQYLVKRKPLTICFSKAFEGLLLSAELEHISLTHDLEEAAQKGLALLESLEDAHDIKDVTRLKELIARTNELTSMDGEYFPNWQINISEDLLDEVDLVILAHGEDLVELGLHDAAPGTVLVLLATATILEIKFL